MPFDFLPPKDFRINWLSNILTINVPDEGHAKNRVVWTKLDINVIIIYTCSIKKHVLIRRLAQFYTIPPFLCVHL